MDFKVFLSREALNDLERIVDYIASHNPEAADRLGNQLLDLALSLGRLPERGEWYLKFGSCPVLARGARLSAYHSVTIRIHYSDMAPVVFAFGRALCYTETS